MVIEKQSSQLNIGEIVMIFSFKNTTEKDLDIFIEPSTDQFLLIPNSTIKIYAVLKNSDDDFQFDYCSDGIVIWMPKVASAKFFVDGKKVFSLYENIDWSPFSGIIELGRK